MTGFDTCNTLRRGVFPYITPTLIGMPRIELGSHAYKAWALTNKQQNLNNQMSHMGGLYFKYSRNVILISFSVIPQFFAASGTFIVQS